MKGKDKFVAIWLIFAAISVVSILVYTSNSVQEEREGYKQYCVDHGYSDIDQRYNQIIYDSYLYGEIIGRTIRCIGPSGAHAIPYEP